ncbi:hypothetical protein F5Y14DRAFT_146022 [Nemania sp. NC0429]|nr:hypothetical protein F5Y14DRAFT_146022 [Nemania sp. NC0429]
MAKPGQNSGIPRTACDRCYELKVRCDRGSTKTACYRCRRLSFACSTVRPVRPCGRRPLRRTPPVPSNNNNPSKESSIGAWLENVPSLLPEERELLLFLLGRPENIDCYVVCPRFRVAAQKSLEAQLLKSFPVVKDAYLACASTLKQLDRVLPGDNDDSVRRASSAMVQLRSLPIANSQDAARCLTLGAALALSVYSTIGLGVADICHYCLTATSPFVDKKEASDDDANSWHGVLVLLEIMDCLVYRRKPTPRIQLRDMEHVDRQLGISSPILRYYYDLCVISHSLASMTDASGLAPLHKRLDEIRGSVEAWIPSHESLRSDQFESAEIIILLAQAKAYRLGALLVGHRLRYTFGEHDEQADIWSKEIIIELEMARRVTTRPIRYVTLPFLVAALEIRDHGARKTALEGTAYFVDHFALVVQEAAKAFLCRIWHERDSQILSSWFDSVCKPCPILQSLDIT